MLCPYCKQNDWIIHTFCNCHGTKWIFSEVIKWFNDENATSFALFSSELIFGLNNDRKNQSSSEIVKKFDFTPLFAKYYLYTNTLAPKELSLDEFNQLEVWCRKPLSSLRGDRIQLTRISCKLTGLMLSCELLQLLYHSFSFLCNFGPICNIVI